MHIICCRPNLGRISSAYILCRKSGGKLVGGSHCVTESMNLQKGGLKLAKLVRSLVDHMYLLHQLAWRAVDLGRELSKGSRQDLYRRSLLYRSLFIRKSPALRYLPEANDVRLPTTLQLCTYTQVAFGIGNIRYCWEPIGIESRWSRWVWSCFE